MAPIVCPRPGPHGPGSDCPLWTARQKVQLQWAIEAGGAACAQMSALVWADMNRGFRRPGSPPTRPAPLSVPSISALPESIAGAVAAIEEEVSQHA